MRSVVPLLLTIPLLLWACDDGVLRGQADRGAVTDDAGTGLELGPVADGRQPDSAPHGDSGQETDTSVHDGAVVDGPLPADAVLPVDLPPSIDAVLPVDLPPSVDAALPMDLPPPIDAALPADLPPPTDVASPVDLSQAVDAAPPTGGSRGYQTTPAELAAIKAKAAQGIEPYATAVSELKSFAGNPGDWSWGTLDGKVDCGGSSGNDPDEPRQLSNWGGSSLVIAKVYMYHITGNAAWAADARKRILDLVDTTYWGGEVYNGANQCILNLSWGIPRYIHSADLLEGYSGWTAQDKLSFATWLATEVYKKSAAISLLRQNNWGSAGSHTAALIADYLAGSSITQLKDKDGSALSLSAAFALHNKQQIKGRMNGEQKMDSKCSIWGIQSHGGIPDELRRGSSGCTATYLLTDDASYGYQQAHIMSLVAHAELLLRRGDSSMYDNITAQGKGSLLQSIHFVIANPIKSWPWTKSGTPSLELAYRYYRDADICAELSCNDPSKRVVQSRGNKVISFGTLTHGFAPGENPGPPPVTPPP